GVDLAQLLAARGPLPLGDVVDWLVDACETLARAHAQGVIHRDLKPANLFLSRGADGTSRVKILDFGISKSLADHGPGGAFVTSRQALLGSPAYMSPEQLRSAKAVDARADVWSLGIIAYELVTGMLPFRGENVGALFAAILAQAPAPPRTLRAELPAAF